MMCTKEAMRFYLYVAVNVVLDQCYEVVRRSFLQMHWNTLSSVPFAATEAPLRRLNGI